MFLIVVIDTL